MDRLLDHLIKIYKGTLYSMAAQDSEFLREYCEERFANRVIESLGRLEQQGDKLIAFEDFQANQGDPIIYKAYEVDSVLVRGLSVQRNENGAADEYHFFNDIEEMGILVFTPNKLGDVRQFVDQKNADKMYEDYRKVLLRVLLRIQSPLRLKLQK